jgi:hypothetical protein
VHQQARSSHVGGWSQLCFYIDALRGRLNPGTSVCTSSFIAQMRNDDVSPDSGPTCTSLRSDRERGAILDDEVVGLQNAVRRHGKRSTSAGDAHVERAAPPLFTVRPGLAVKSLSSD